MYYLRAELNIIIQRGVGLKFTLEHRKRKHLELYRTGGCRVTRYGFWSTT